MDIDQPWCEQVADMRAAIELVNDCMFDYAWTMEEEQTEQVKKAMNRLKKSYKALKSYNGGFMT